MFPSSPSINQWPINLLMFTIVVATIANFVDFHCCPSNLHIYLHLSTSVLQPLVTWYHVPSWSFSFFLSFTFLVEMTYVVYQHSTYLHVLMLALKMVPLSFSSSFKPLLLCFLVLFLPLIVRLHLPQLCSSSWEHSFEILLQFFLCFPMLPASPLWLSWPWFVVSMDDPFGE